MLVTVLVGAFVDVFFDLDLDAAVRVTFKPDATGNLHNYQPSDQIG